MFTFHGSYQERSAFEVFRSQVTSQLSGHFDAWFWDTVVLQASHREPTIRHAVLALSGLVQRARSQDRTAINIDASEGVFALQHYNQAIRELKSAAQKRELTLDVCLITCLLFASFEVVRRHHGAALCHTRSGVKILSELQDEADGRQSSAGFAVAASPYIDSHRLEILFHTLNTHGMQVSNPYQSAWRTSNRFGPDIRVARCFTTDVVVLLPYKW